MEKPIVLVIGTRPEGIKLIPLYFALKKAGFNALLCATFQHFELLEQVCKIFDVVPDFHLNVMKKDQDLFYLNTTVLERVKEVYLSVKPELVIVQGDTTTTFAAALAAFYLHIPVAHVEAGLRTGNMKSPFPEEMNRRVVAQFATYHFAPTAFSTANLLSEGVPRERVFCTGNTVVDALNIITDKIKSGVVMIDSALKLLVEDLKLKKRKIMLLTAHRRESFGGGLHRVFKTVKQFAHEHPDLFIFYPMHPNPSVVQAVQETGFVQLNNVYHTGPLSYHDMVYLLLSVDFVATDSGGLQEEAVSLGKPVICLRDITERWEGVWEGTEVLVGTDPHKIHTALDRFYRNQPGNMVVASSVYGDGNACKRIVSILKNNVSPTVAEQSLHLHTLAYQNGMKGSTGAV